VTKREKQLLGHIATLLAMVQREKRWVRPRAVIEAIEADVGFSGKDAALANVMRIANEFQRRDDVEGDADRRANGDADLTGKDGTTTWTNWKTFSAGKNGLWKRLSRSRSLK
jgi:hypothetical protein